MDVRRRTACDSNNRWRPRSFKSIGQAQWIVERADDSWHDQHESGKSERQAQGAMPLIQAGDGRCRGGSAEGPECPPPMPPSRPCLVQAETDVAQQKHATDRHDPISGGVQEECLVQVGGDLKKTDVPEIVVPWPGA